MTLDDAIDELYGADSTRSSPSGRGSSRADARRATRTRRTQLAKLRKPTVFAWALNQLARHERRDVDLLLDAGHRLREAQAGVLRGGGDRVEFERAREIENDALRRLERAAGKLLAERGARRAACCQQISSTLRTAAVSEEGRELLARGRFAAPLESEGFGALAGLAPPTCPRRPAPRKQSATARGEEEAARGEAAACASSSARRVRRTQRADGLAKQSAAAERESGRPSARGGRRSARRTRSRSSPRPELGRAARQVLVALGDAALGVRRPAERHLLVRDADVRMVVLRLGELRDAVDEGDRLRERRQLERPLERAVHLAQSAGALTGAVCGRQKPPG